MTRLTGFGSRTWQWFQKVRAFLLYNKMPFDRSIWTKIRTPWYFILMGLASSTNMYIRGGFFTFYLFCLSIDMEEFQMMFFILGLKGTQFISGGKGFPPRSDSPPLPY